MFLRNTQSFVEVVIVYAFIEVKCRELRSDTGILGRLVAILE